jgi:hypothetical protein
VHTYTVHPGDFGLPSNRPEELRGGDASCNADLTLRLLHGEALPQRGIVLLNAAAASAVGAADKSIADCLPLAQEARQRASARQTGTLTGVYQAMVADILARILDWKRQEVALARQTLPLAELRQRCESQPATPGCRQALQAPPDHAPRIIAEIKTASPSAGLIRADFDPVAIAEIHARQRGRGHFRADR